MNKPQAIEGQWWIYGKDKPSYFGVLSFDPDKGFGLSIKIPRSRTIAEAFSAMFEKARNIENVPTVIAGANENAEPITLFGCQIARQTTGTGLDSYRIYCQAAITNYDGFSWEDAKFAAARIKYTLLTSWMNRRLMTGLDEEKKAKIHEAIKNRHFSYDFQLYDDLKFEPSNGVQIIITGTPMPSVSLDSFQMRLEHTLYFIFREEYSPQAIFENFVLVFLRLLSLLSGERVFVEDFELYDRDPFLPGFHPKQQHQVLLRNQGVTNSKMDKPGGHMIANFEEIQTGFEEILKRWFACHDRLRSALDLHFAVLSNWVLTDQTQFLLFAQALEVYYSRSTNFNAIEKPEQEHQSRIDLILASVPARFQSWLKYKLKFSNEKPLSQKINDILKLHKDETAQLTARIPDFADKVRDSRNFYTHYNEKVFRDGKVAVGLELRRIAFALRNLLEVCLLKELGINGKPIERILERNANVEWPDLKKIS